MTEEEIIQKVPEPKTLDEALAELRFMCEAYKVVIVQRDLARKSEADLQRRIKVLKDTLESFTKG